MKEKFIIVSLTAFAEYFHGFDETDVPKYTSIKIKAVEESSFAAYPDAQNVIMNKLGSGIYQIEKVFVKE